VILSACSRSALITVHYSMISVNVNICSVRLPVQWDSDHRCSDQTKLLMIVVLLLNAVNSMHTNTAH
jgi:hypothetical protein